MGACAAIELLPSLGWFAGPGRSMWMRSDGPRLVSLGGKSGVCGGAVSAFRKRLSAFRKRPC